MGRPALLAYAQERKKALPSVRRALLALLSSIVFTVIPRLFHLLHSLWRYIDPWSQKYRRNLTFDRSSSFPSKVPRIFASHPCMVDAGGLRLVPSGLNCYYVNFECQHRGSTNTHVMPILSSCSRGCWLRMECVDGESMKDVGVVGTRGQCYCSHSGAA